jgi:DNA topoisomerase I
VLKSSPTISHKLDKAMDKQISSNGHLSAGISIRNGPVEEMDIDEPHVNGFTNGKRKSRGSIGGQKSYKESTSTDEDDKPLVG